MIGPFESGRLLLARARKHLTEFEAGELRFNEEKPYTFFDEIEPNTGHTLFKARVNKPTPPELSPIAFDTINCLRSALDHVVYDASIVLGGKAKPKYTKFPFGATAEQAGSDLARKAAEVPASIHPYLLSFEPYEGGKEALWELNELRNEKIHRTLVAVAAANGGFGIREGYFAHATMDSIISEWDGAKGEVTYMRMCHGSKYSNVKVRVYMHIAFGKGTCFGSKRVVTVLSDLAKVVDRILNGVEAETARLVREQTS